MGRHRLGIQECEAQAAGDHGIIPRSSALAAGLDDSAISTLLQNRRWLTLQPRAYVVAGAPITWRTRLAAVDASLERGFAFSHRTAGALMGLDGVAEGYVDIVTPDTPRLRDVTVHRLRSGLPPVVHVGGFPVTSAHRTILDLFAVLPPKTAELALEDALRKGLTTIGRLSAEYARTCNKGRNGCRAFRASLLRHDDRDGKLQSRMEAKLRRIVKKLPGDEAVPQFEVQTPKARYFIDFAYPDIKLGIEAQSIRWHKGDAKFGYDVKRDRRLKGLGWTLIYYSWDDLLCPADVGAEISSFRDSMRRLLF